MQRIFNIKNPDLVTINDILKLEKISRKKFDLVQRILFINSGNTQQLLEVLKNSATHVKIIEQIEGKNTIKRKSCIMSSVSNEILAYANSKIYFKKVPVKVLEEIRTCKVGIGKIILYHRLEIFKKITEIGYVPGECIFKNYSLFYRGYPICKIKESFPIQIK